MYAAAHCYKINDEPVNMTIGYDLTSSDQQTNLATIQTACLLACCLTCLLACLPCLVALLACLPACLLACLQPCCLFAIYGMYEGTLFPINLLGSKVASRQAGKQGNKARKAGKQATRLKYYA